MCKCHQHEMELLPELEALMGEYQEEFEFSNEIPVATGTCATLPATKTAAAVNANRSWAKQIGWGCLQAGKAAAIQPLVDFLKFLSPPTEEALACAIAAWQSSQKMNPTGILDNRTWEAMAVIRKIAYPLSIDVYFGGQKLGILEKSTPYIPCYSEPDGSCNVQRTATSVSGGVEIELGFRITNMAAVKKAGFIDENGFPKFRWIQVIETNRKLDQQTQTLIKRYSKYVDPNPVAGKFDKHPYYWNEKNEGSDPGMQVQRYTNTAFPNKLCYDLIFYDRPSRPLNEALTGKRVFWNAQMALVGVRSGNKNVILDSVSWGFDIVVNAGKPEIKRNGLNRSVYGGSSMFRKILNDAILAGQFPGHCFTGPGFRAAAACK